MQYLRIIDNAVPEELLVENPLSEELKYPAGMRDDVIPVDFQIDIDRRQHQLPRPPRPEM